jgi:NAD+ kinase
VYREHTDEVLAIIERVRSWAALRDIEVHVEKNAGRGPDAGLDLVATPVDLVVALGGDGTFLRASRLAVRAEAPVLGVNLGRLGFLTAVPDVELERGLDAVVSGEALVEHRFGLRARIEKTDAAPEEDFFALNDVVVHTSGAARVTPLTLRIGNGPDFRDPRTMEEVGSFGADGVIVATPTGSTAYSMSAGGPIIVPEVEAMVVTPICPHSLAVRPLVVPASSTICVGSLDPDGDHQLTVDGQVVHDVKPGQYVMVGRDERPLSLLRLPGQTFFSTLRKKLNWAARTPERG